MERTLVIGDVHGCRTELEALLEACERTDRDSVVFVGDLVAKGPDSRGVIRLARDVGALSVRGNHDQHVLRWREAQREGAPLPTLRPAHQQVVDTLDESDWQWLEALPLYLEIPEHDTLVVHAGVAPGVPLADQDPNHLMNMRSIRPDGTPSKRIEDGVPWASLWPGPAHVVFGHDAVRQLQRWPHAIGIDTGCCYGGALTAWMLPDRQLVSVPAARAYTAPGGDR